MVRWTASKKPHLSQGIGKSIIYGYHGQGNFGDDIFFDVLVDQFLNPKGICSISVKCGGVEVPHESRLNIKKIRSPKYFTRLVWVKLAWEMMQAKYVIFCAGSLFKSQSFLGFLIAVLIAKIASLGRVKIYAIGVSIGPISRRFDMINMRIASSLMDYIGVRDIASLDYIDQRNSEYVGDIAVPHLIKMARRYKCKFYDINNRIVSQSIGVCVSASIFSDTLCLKALIANIEAVAGGGLLKDLKIIVACIDPIEGDCSASNAFYQAISNAGLRITTVYHRPANPDYLFEALSTCACVISCRMHVTLAALSLGIPAVQYSYAEKIPDVFQTLGISKEIYPSPSEFPKSVQKMLLDIGASCFSEFSNEDTQQISSLQGRAWKKLREANE